MMESEQSEKQEARGTPEPEQPRNQPRFVTIRVANPNRMRALEGTLQLAQRQMNDYLMTVCEEQRVPDGSNIRGYNGEDGTITLQLPDEPTMPVEINRAERRRQKKARATPA